MLVGALIAWTNYWDRYEFAVAVVATNGDAEKVELSEKPFEPLAEWCDYTSSERGCDISYNCAGKLLLHSETELDPLRVCGTVS
ncbi:hypothetical protein GCM10009067_40060 [Haloarcula sebkhae]|uniref:Uncharacterized protein n=1 Tax=Haloarcula sebkhae TaxID=932660 RepID=A0A830EX35_9EURY|nr:hypothetical protein GCM10009067_40060 [Haloarcula sebkhae]